MEAAAPGCDFRDGPYSGVYFIVSGGYVKIGVSSNVLSRFRSIQNANPNTVVGERFIHEPNPGMADTLEAALHQRFAAHRYRGEWFTLCPEIHAFMLNEAAQWPGLSMGPWVDAGEYYAARRAQKASAAHSS